MFVVTEADAAVIRTVYQQRGELSAAIELRRWFPGITDNAQARECARTIAGWCRHQPPVISRLPSSSVGPRISGPAKSSRSMRATPVSDARPGSA
jgi:hypothetical protein